MALNGSDLNVLDPEMVAISMKAHRGVLKWALQHRVVNGHIWSLLYVVPHASNSPKQLVSSLMTKLVSAGASVERLSIVPVSLLPTTITGAIDDAALSLLPVIDDSTAADCARFLSKNLNAGEIRVRIIDAEEVPPKLTFIAHSASFPEIPTSQRWAVLEGPPPPEDKKQTLTDLLIYAAATDRGITFVSTIPPRHQTYKALLKAAQQGAYAMLQEGCQQREKVLLQFSNHEHFITGFWSCVLAGLIPVPMSFDRINKAGEGSVHKLRQVCNVLGNVRILTSSQEDADFLTSQLGDLNASILIFDQLQAATSSDSIALPQVRPDDLVLLLCTSGSTGAPKLVEHTHHSILARPDAVAARYNFAPTDVSLNWVPLDHVGGLLFFSIFKVCMEALNKLK